MSTAHDSSNAPGSPSLAGRAAAAIALTLGFYLLALAVVAGLLALAVLPWTVLHSGNIWVTLTAGLLAWTVLRGAVPRRSRFTPPGPRVGPGSQPRLVELVREEAEAAGQRPPDEIYVTLEPNASVTEHGRRRRILVVGLPLLRILSERQLRGVIAHEFGHYAGGDTRLGPWIFRTQDMIGRTLAGLHASRRVGRNLVRGPFEWYARAFVRITCAISRREELAADARAARRVGRAAHVEALRRARAFAPAFDAYWSQEVVPVLESGRRAAVADGFGRFIAADAIRRAAAELLDEELADPVRDPYATHPSLAERIAAVAALPEGPPDSSPCAIGLLDDTPEVERQALAAVLGSDAGGMEPIDWDDVPRAVWLSRARGAVERWPRLLAGVTAGGLDDAVAALPRTADRLVREGCPVEQAPEVVAGVLGDGLLVALAAAGWEVVAPMAEPVAARRGDDVVQPAVVVAELRNGSLSGDAWRERAAALGISDLTLGSAAAPAEPIAAG